MSLDMRGHIDSVFKSTNVTVEFRGGEYNELGVWEDFPSDSTPYDANVQPLNQRELDNLLRAGQRIIDGRKIYINSGDFSKLELSQTAVFLDQKWKIIQSDIRPWNNYAKIVVSRFDDQ